jgi:hypothetical protein
MNVERDPATGLPLEYLDEVLGNGETTHGEGNRGRIGEQSDTADIRNEARSGGHPIPQGQNDAALYAEACRLYGLGMQYDDVVVFLRGFPIDQDDSNPYTEEDYKRIAGSAKKYEEAPREPVLDETGEAMPFGTPPSWIPKAASHWDQERPQPSVLEIAEGLYLFYRGHLNGVVGASETFKTWLVCMAIMQELRGGGVVVYFDFESSPIIARLKEMGASDELLEGFRYCQPQDQLPGVQEDRRHVIAAVVGDATLAVADGMTEAMALEDREINSNSDAAWFENEVLKPMTRGGDTTVLYVHHTPHAGDRAIGAQHFKSMVTGSSILTEVDAMGKTVYLSVNKDRHGGLVEMVQRRKSFASLVLEHDPNATGAPLVFQTHLIERTTSGQFVPTDRIDEVVAFVAAYQAEHGEGPSQRKILKANGITGRESVTKRAITLAVKRGRLTVKRGVHYDLYEVENP